MTDRSTQILFRVISAVGLIASVALCIYGWKTGIFTSQEKLQSYIIRFGIAGALVFVSFQAVQVVIPVLPGGLGCLGGVLLFGPWRGFLYNYVGICIGSVLAFLVAKYYGKPILRCFFTQKLITKYEQWTSEKNRFAKLFAIAIFLPVAPDDFLCYLAGTTEMSLPTFTSIILLGKPFAIALYSMGLMALFSRIPAFLAG
ncbi:MAG: VTT domain-containing protein [Oscillospiraceae bacterium]|nr:VTT domain-containing protein [Oscillospiraceae bacterium]